MKEEHRLLTKSSKDDDLFSGSFCMLQAQQDIYKKPLGTCKMPLFKDKRTFNWIDQRKPTMEYRVDIQKINFLRAKISMLSEIIILLRYSFKRQKKHVKKRLPSRDKWTELGGELILGGRRWWTFHYCFQKFVKAWPALWIFRLHVRKPSDGALKNNHAHTPNVTAIVVSTPTNSLWLIKEIKTI